MDESRKQFEWWFSDQGRHLYAVEKSNGDYLLASAESSWQAWQASRAAIEIELPAKIEREVRDTDIDDERRWGHNDAIRDCADAIRAAGIKVKE